MKILFYFICFLFINNLLIAQNINKLSYHAIDSMLILHENTGNYELGVQLATETTKRTFSETGKEDSITAVYTEWIAYFYELQLDYNQAEKYYLKSNAIFLASLGKKSENYCLSLHWLATLYRDISNYEKAEELYMQVVEIRKEVLGEEDPIYANSLNNLAILYFLVGSYEQALPLYLKALEIKKSSVGENHSDYAASLNSLAELYRAIGNFEQALPLYLQAIEIIKNTLGETHPYYAASLNNLAILYKDMGNYNQVEPLYLEAIEIMKKTFGKKHPSYASSLNNLANFYQIIGNSEQAKSLFLDVLALDKATLGENHPFYATTLNNLGSLYQKTGKNDLAEALYLQALEIERAALGETHPEFSNNLNRIGKLYAQQGLYSKSLSYYWQAIRVNCKAERLDSAQLFNNFSELSTKEFYSYPNLINTLTDIYALNQIQYNNLVLESKEHRAEKMLLLKNAYSALQTAMQINEKVRHSLSEEQDKLRTLNKMSSLVKNAIATGLILSEKGDNSYHYNAFTYAEQNKSVLLADALKGSRARALGDLPDSLALYEIELQQKKKNLEKIASEARTDEAKNELRAQENELNLEINSFFKHLKENYPKYIALKYENITAKAQDVQTLIDDKTLFLEYFIADTMTYLFAISKNELKLFSIPIKKEQLKSSIKNLRQALSDYKFILDKKDEAYQLFTQTASFFYSNLIKAALEQKGIENLVIVTDGELGHLPFEVFLTQAAPQRTSEYKNLHYLVNDYNISYNYSATLFVEAQQSLLGKKGQPSSSVKAGQILACAAAYPTIDSTILGLRPPHIFTLRSQLKPLPAAQNEVAALSELFQGEFLQSDSTNEAYFKKNAHQYSIIHLAMHGILHPRTAILSSLAFSENKDSLEDNFLQAYEIAHLHLNADLVVLSACETGYGKFEQGEGVISLARSFMYAGVPSLVVSLWQVNDGSTAMIMKSFYQYLSEGMTKDAALRQAKLDYIKTASGIAAHPAFWSPFIQLGDSHPIQIAAKTNKTIWWLGGLFLLLSVGGFILFKRKDHS